jgi:DNA-binding CsgD family transcriptional regulator
VGRDPRGGGSHATLFNIQVDCQVLIARRDELTLIENFLDEPGCRGLLLEGDAGIGKTRVWKAGVDASQARGFTVLATRASGSEVRLSFAGLSDLLSGLASPVFASLPPPQQRALDAALLRTTGQREEMATRAVGQALLGVLRYVGAESPTLLAVDDLQWLDPPSGRAVSFALRRLSDEPVALLATARIRSHEPTPLDLDRLLPDGRLRRVPIGPLSERSIDELLRARLGLNPSRAALTRLHQRAGGNPFFALEIGRLLGEKRVEGSDDLPLPHSLRQLVHERLAQLPARTRRALLTAASLAQPRIDLLGRGAEADLRPAVQTGIVSLDAGVVRFAHPLLAFVPYEEAPPAVRRRIHARLADAVVDLEERARHLALAAVRPDERVAAELDEAARRALTRGAPDAAAELTRLARRLTPGSDVERRLAEAEYTFESGDSARARALMEEVIRQLDAGPPRAHALARLAWLRGIFGDDPRGALALLESALEQASGDLAVEAEVYEGLTWHSHLVGRPDAARYARLGAAAAEHLGDPHWVGLLALALSLAEGKAGRPQAARAALRRLEAVSGTVSHHRMVSDPAWLRAIFLASDGDVHGALLLVRELHGRAVELGDESSLPYLLGHLALFEFRAGAWQAADEHLDEALQIARQTDQQNHQLSLQAWRAVLDVHLGRSATAEQLALRIIAEAEARVLPIYADVARWALMLLAIANGEPDAALAAFNGQQRPDRGLDEHVLFRHYGDAAEALIMVGDLGAAATTIRRWRARAAALDHAVAGPGADRCAGLLAAADGNVGRGLRLLERAVARGRTVPEPFELARSLLALGTLQRQAMQKRAAAATLGEALHLFERLPAPLWVERTRRELARIGGRRVDSGALTGTEQRVAALVAAGRSNAEVARELVLSTKTVEWNLSKVYRKLGVRSRAELAARGVGQI